MSLEEVSFNYPMIAFVQINDVYQIDAAVNGSLILPRIATAVERLKTWQGIAQALLCLPGDFLAPSCLSRQFRGQHMIDVLNAMGLDYVSFGNHEFEDLFSSAEVQDCIEKSKFTWLGTNFVPCSREWRALDNLKSTAIVELSPRTRLVLCGFLYEAEFPKFGRTTPLAQAAATLVELIDSIKQDDGSEVDAFAVGLTHQEVAKDVALAQAVPRLRFIMGGHDHDEREDARPELGLIVKALSNGRTFRLNTIVEISDEQLTASRHEHAGHPGAALEHFDRHVAEEIGRLSVHMALARALDVELEVVDGQCRNVNRHVWRGKNGILVGSSVQVSTHDELFHERVPAHPVVERAIRKWSAESRADARPFARCAVELELRDAKLRSRSTNFGNFVCDAMRGVHGGELVDVALLNGGCFRLDDRVLSGSHLSARTLCDIFFHKNAIELYELTLAQLVAIIEVSRRLADDGRRQDGHFLQISGLIVGLLEEGGLNLLDSEGTPLPQERPLRVAANSYLATSKTPYAALFPGATRTLWPDLQQLVAETLANVRDLDATTAPPFDRWVWDHPG